MPKAAHALTAAVGSCARLETVDHSVTMGVVQDLKDLFVIRQAAGVRVDQASMDVSVIKYVLRYFLF